MKNIIPVILSIVMLLTLIFSAGFWTFPEQKSYDFRLSILEHSRLFKTEPSGMVVVVGMEENDIGNVKPLIFWYPDIGRFLSRMKEYDARVVGLDLIPVHSLGRKIKGVALETGGSASEQTCDKCLTELGFEADNALIKPLAEATKENQIVQAVTEEHYPYYFALLQFIKNVTVASVKLKPDNDKIIRKQWLTEKGHPDAFPYTLYRFVGGKRIEADEIYINYLLFHNISYYSFHDVMAGKVDKRAFSGKAVILGYISRSEDMHPTPLSYMSGSMLHAVSLETLFSNRFFKGINNVLSVSLLLVLTCIGYFISMLFKPVRAISIIFLCLMVYMIVNLISFINGHILPIFPHILSPLLIFAGIYPYRYVIGERYRKKIHDAFSYYVDPRLLDTLIEKEPESLLKGETKEICILFLDIRDFTVLSRTCDAKKIVGFLNVFFDAVTGIIQHHNGFLNKFLGDGLLAFFSMGENRVTDAVQASIEIIAEIKRMNEKGAFLPFIEDWHVSIGIGIHSGIVVMGNIGSKKKMDYTVIGSAVNLTSRIEGLTKAYHKQLLLSEAAYEKIRGTYQFECIGASRVKGYDEPMNIYARKEQG